jgi:hypothetical protein
MENRRLGQRAGDIRAGADLPGVTTQTSHNRCVTLWIGEALGPVERACMMSVIRQGHELRLYCYREPFGVPAGVELGDAADIVPESELFLVRGGSVASFADWFRYELLARDLGTWIDTDMYLLRPLDGHAETLLGEQQPGVINNAVLRLPSNSPVLRALVDLFERRKTPPGLPWRHYLASRLRVALFGAADLSRLPWGATGPIALTALAKRFGIAGKAVPSDVFYPVSWDRADWLIDPRAKLDEVANSRTVGIHLWNECIKGFKNKPAPRGSFLHRLQEEGAE